MSSRGSLRSMDWMIYTLLPDLDATLFTTKSSGLSISFSSTYFAMRSMNGWPNLRALPSPTPWHFSESSLRVRGYTMVMSSSEGSLNTTQGWTLILRATSLRRSLSIARSTWSPPPPPRTAAASSSSSSSPSENVRSSTSISSLGCRKNSRPASVTEMRP